MGKTRTPPKPAPSKAQPPKPRKYYKGRPVYTLEDLADPNFKLGLPPEPEWEAEWKRKNPKYA